MLELNITTKSDNMESEVEVKLEPYHDSPSIESNETETYFYSEGDVKVEIVDLDFPTSPTGLIPPVEVEEYKAVLNKTKNASCERIKHVDKPKTGKKGKHFLVQRNSMRSSQEQSKTTNQPLPTKTKLNVSSEEIQRGPRKCPKKAGTCRRSTKEEPFLCDACGKKFRRSDLLTDHMKIHRRQKPYLCDHCGMKFAKPSYLKIHLRRHAGDRPVMCDQCDKRFFDTYDLKVHQRDHTGERPYKCSECGKDFKRIYILNKHKLTHSKERPFQCSVCGKAYRYGYSYRLHMKEHLNERP